MTPDPAALELARKFAFTDPAIRLVSVSNPVEMILTLMHQRWVLAKEVVRLSSEARQDKEGAADVAQV